VEAERWRHVASFTRRACAGQFVDAQPFAVDRMPSSCAPGAERHRGQEVAGIFDRHVSPGSTTRARGRTPASAPLTPDLFRRADAAPRELSRDRAAQRVSPSGSKSLACAQPPTARRQAPAVGDRQRGAVDLPGRKSKRIESGRPIGTGGIRNARHANSAATRAPDAARRRIAWARGAPLHESATHVLRNPASTSHCRHA
jgi:hypothetical protein